MRLAIIGIQGSGKGTQAKLIAKEFKLRRIATGKILREEIKAKSKDGKNLAKYVNKGLMAPNPIVNKLILKKTPKNNFIIDGFPRDKRQLKVADKTNLDKLILLTLPRKEVYQRIKLRRELENRIDDHKKSLDTRLKLFYKNSPEIIKYFKGRIIKIDGNQSIKKVFLDIKRALRKQKLK